jgi:large subunit ribosomal protein L9
MKLILKESIENLGKKGDLVDVAAGYGRNYLVPKKLAVEVTPANTKMVEMIQKSLRKGLEKEMKVYQSLIQKLNDVTLTFSRKAGETDAIFGSVSVNDIRDALSEQDFEIEKKKILLEEPIKRLGNYTIPIKIFQDERAEIKVEVIKEGEPEAPSPEGVAQETAPQPEPAAVDQSSEEAPAGAEAPGPEDETET